jgi:hypothetical protein
MAEMLQMSKMQGVVILQGPEATTSFTKRVDKECGHEESNREADSNLYHARSDVEANGVEVIRSSRVLLILAMSQTVCFYRSMCERVNASK